MDLLILIINSCIEILYVTVIFWIHFIADLIVVFVKVVRFIFFWVYFKYEDFFQNVFFIAKNYPTLVSLCISQLFNKSDDEDNDENK